MISVNFLPQGLAGYANLLLMVPSARLELAQLSPLPPQDSVSTNFTTTAEQKGAPNGLIERSTDSKFNPKPPHFEGIWLTGDRSVAGDVAGAAGAGVGAFVAPAGAGALAFSNTLLVVTGRTFPKNAKPKVQTKNRVANTAVERDKKLAPPEAPNKLPELPLPKAAPMSAPFPCCMRIKPIMAKALSTWTTMRIF